MVTLPNAMLKYSAAATAPVPPRPTMNETSWWAKFLPASAAANTPKTMDACAPITEPRPTAQNVLPADVLRGR